MAKKLGIIVASIVVIIIVGISIFLWSGSAKEPKLSVAEIRRLVESQYPGTISEPVLVAGENGTVYDVTSNNGDKSYKIRMDGNTGEVLSINMQDNSRKIAQKGKTVEKEKDANKKEEQPDQPGNNGTQQRATSDAVIDLEQAKEIALKQFTGTFEKIELEKDNDRLSYEIEMKNETAEAEILIDAYTGDVILLDIESADDED
ncbi:PepSY domain-containing protein [Oceanobacillus chungangensis]|uniref:PepSY domain-containing protein n=1 Tax=Oceanobacillus chungangensis TaxID=1229152 RepID=A0A3D8PIK9_9BACI|nr:PepSY domain-containing protein [Oceanobacillus chungangensis]RDW15069.1 hypothetical protein CWR45_18810 [Oceanobacillus chungangensis]